MHMHSGSTSCPHWVCGVCPCVCVCTAPTCLVKTVQIQFTKQSQSLRTRNARCYLYRKWDLRDAIRKHDRHKPNQRASELTYASNPTNVCISLLYIYHMLQYICTAYMCNVLVINTELYWLTVMGKWAKSLAMCVLIPFATYAKYEIQI